MGFYFFLDTMMMPPSQAIAQLALKQAYNMALQYIDLGLHNSRVT